MEQGNNVQWRLGSLERRVEQMEGRSELLTTLRIELREVKREVSELLKANKERDEREQSVRAQLERDRKADAKWKAGIWIAAAAAVISAAAIIVPLLVS